MKMYDFFYHYSMASNATIEIINVNTKEITAVNIDTLKHTCKREHPLMKLKFNMITVKDNHITIYGE